MERYDDLHRLISSEGEYRDPKGVNTYTNDFTYDTIGNILTKVQVNDFDPAEGPAAPVPGTTYTFNYSYGAKPHAVVSTGDTTYTYDASGNMTTMKGPAIDRKITWDEENRVTKTLDRRDETVYSYDDGGIRAIKRGKYGETFYAGENLSIRNGTIESKHIFAGNARVVTKVANKGKDAGTYYYHGDHLGSSNSITTKAGAVHEHLEYFPYGETWVHKLLAKAESLPFKFTGKEYDPETGWFYFGARYYDARLSRWTAVDPALDKYFPNPNDFDTEHDYFWYLEQDASAKLPGIGGVFNSINLDMYHYAGQNPVKLVDPDGEAIFIPPAVYGIAVGAAYLAATPAGQNLMRHATRLALRAGPMIAATLPRAGIAITRGNPQLMLRNAQGLIRHSVPNLLRSIVNPQTSNQASRMAAEKLGTMTNNAIVDKIGLGNLEAIKKGVEIYSGTAPNPPSSHLQNIGFLINEVIQKFKKKE